MPREMLKDYLGQRIKVRGVFGHYGVKRSARVNDVEAIKDGVYIDNHVWVQNASALYELDLQGGEVLEMSCRVGTYYKRAGLANEQVMDYQLSFPMEVMIVGKPTALAVPELKPPVPTKPAARPAVDPVELVGKVNDLVSRAGGAANVRGYLAIRPAVDQLILAAGGEDKLVALVEMFSPKTALA